MDTISRENNSMLPIGGIIVELVSSEHRTVRAAEVMRAWRQEVVEAPGVESLTFLGQRTGPPGGDLDIRLAGGERIEDLKAAEIGRAHV